MFLLALLLSVDWTTALDADFTPEHSQAVAAALPAHLDTLRQETSRQRQAVAERQEEQTAALEQSEALEPDWTAGSEALYDAAQAHWDHLDSLTYLGSSLDEGTRTPETLALLEGIGSLQAEAFELQGDAAALFWEALAHTPEGTGRRIRVASAYVGLQGFHNDMGALAPVRCGQLATFLPDDQLAHAHEDTVRALRYTDCAEDEGFVAAAEAYLEFAAQDEGKVMATHGDEIYGMDDKKKRKRRNKD